MRESHYKEAVLDLNFYRDWAAKRKAALEKKKDQRTFFVTVSREFGCEGYDIARKLTDKISEQSQTPWSLFTHKIIEEMVASEAQETVEMVRKVSEKRWTFKDWFVDALAPDYLQSESTHVFEGMRNVILNLADKGNCVILGSGSQIITHWLDPKKFMGVHIRVIASKSWRLNKVAHLFNASREEAEKILKQKQDARARFITDFTGLNSADLSLYHMALNNARVKPDAIASLTAHCLKLNGWEG